MCFRRLNATHQLGCSSKRGGNVGIVFYAKNQEDVEWVTFHSPRQSYVVVMAAKMFQNNVSAILIRSSKIAGIVLIIENERDRPDSFSPDVPCPNDRYGLYGNDDQYSGCKKTVWNPYGNGMMFMDIPFPIVLVSNPTDEKFIIEDCFEKFNGGRDDADVPKCAMEIRDVMDGAKDTPTCIRRNEVTSTFLIPETYCQFGHGLNVFAYLNYVSKTERLKAGSVIIIAARVSSFSLFEDRFPAYESAALGFVTLHAVAEALGKLRLRRVLGVSPVRPVMFALFSGEAYDYVGSSRMVYDIEQGEFLPLTPESIGTFIEVGQVGLNNDSEDIWIHTDPVSISKSQDIRSRVDSLVSLITNIGTVVGLSIKRTSEGSPLPPASLHQFLKSPKISVAGIVFSSHEKEFSNRYYNSFFDNSNLTGPETYNDITPTVQRIEKIAMTVARTVYSLLSGGITSDVNSTQVNIITVRKTHVANLLYCFTRSPDCELFNSTIDVRLVKELAFYHYSYLSRYVVTAPTLMARQHHYLLAHFLGNVVDDITTVEACDALDDDEDDGYTYDFVNGPLSEKDGSRTPVCVRSTVAVVRAVSPAFLISGYDWSSERYSSWTESYWDDDAMSLRIFLQPSRRQEIVTLCVGSVSFVLSLVFVYLIQRKASILFRVID